MKKNRNAERRRRENRGAERRGAEGAEDRGAVGAENRGAEGADGCGVWGEGDFRPRNSVFGAFWALYFTIQLPALRTESGYIHVGDRYI